MNTARSRLIAGGLLAGVFIAGAMLGGAASTLLGDRDGDRDGRHRHGGYAEHLSSELSLDQEQRDSLDAILERRRFQMCQLWRDFHPRFETMQGEVRGEISRMLNDDQLERYQQMIARSDSIRAARKDSSDDC